MNTTTTPTGLRPSDVGITQARFEARVRQTHLSVLAIAHERKNHPDACVTKRMVRDGWAILIGLAAGYGMAYLNTTNAEPQRNAAVALGYLGLSYTEAREAVMAVTGLRP